MFSNEQTMQLLRHTSCEDGIIKEGEKNGVIEMKIGKQTIEFDFKKNPNCLLEECVKILKMSNNEIVTKFVPEEVKSKVDLENRIPNLDDPAPSEAELKKQIKKLKKFINEKEDIKQFITNMKSEESDYALDYLEKFET